MYQCSPRIQKSSLTFGMCRKKTSPPELIEGRAFSTSQTDDEYSSYLLSSEGDDNGNDNDDAVRTRQKITKRNCHIIVLFFLILEICNMYNCREKILKVALPIDDDTF